MSEKVFKLSLMMDTQASSPEKNDGFDVYEFRMLSKTVVGVDSWKCCDFTKGDILKDSINRFKGLPIYLNHDTYDVQNAIGIVSEVYYQEERTDADGHKVPAGINGKFKIPNDTEAGKNLSKMISIGAIFSVSVGIQFTWKYSHNFENPYEYYEKMGTVVNGELVRRVVDSIKDVNEVSLVHMGADPFAKLMNEDGEIVKKDYSSVEVLESLGLSQESGKEKTDIGSIFVRNDFKKEVKKEEVMDFKKILSGLGLSADSVTDEASFLAFMSEEFSNKEKQYNELQAERNELNVQLEALKTQSIELQKLADLYNTHLTEFRSEVETSYRRTSLAKSEEPQDSMISLIQICDEKQLKAISKTLGIEFDGALPHVCNKCGSDDVSLRSSKAEADDNNSNVEAEVVTGLFDTVLKKNYESVKLFK